MKLNSKLAFTFFVVAGLLAAGCGKDKDIPDVSGISIPVGISRFEQDLFTIDTQHIGPTLLALEQKYPEFAPIYFNQVLRSRDSLVAPQGHEQYVKGFIAFPATRKLYDTLMTVYPDVQGLKKDFGRAFQFYKYYFPTQPLSGQVVTYLSEYTIGGFLYGDNSIAVGLDFYLGEKYPYQQLNPENPNFSQYLTRTFSKEYIVEKSMRSLVDDLLGPPPGNRMIDHLIHNGKALYILDRLLPQTPDSIKLEYTQAQTQWCNDNEANIWAYFLSEKLLYSTDWNKYRKFVEPSPNSPGMPEQAPGRTANWLGWRIVESFMKKNPGITPEKLVEIKDMQSIMDRSKYKPKK